MSETSDPHSTEPSHHHYLIPVFWQFSMIVAIIMIVPALLGVALSTTSPNIASTYWISLVPIFGVLCVGTAWRRTQLGGHVDRYLTIRQLFHWIGIGIALGLDFYLSRTGQESRIASGMNALLLLALGCFLAGVHMERLFILVGVVLTILLLFIDKVDEYLWLILILGGLVIAGMIFCWWLLASRAKKVALVSAK